MCDNLFYIKSDLKCDGYNNCGDWSDEASYLCDIVSRPLGIGVIAASCTVCAVALLVTICIVVKSRRRRVSFPSSSLSQVRYTSLPPPPPTPTNSPCPHIALPPTYPSVFICLSDSLLFLLSSFYFYLSDSFFSHFFSILVVSV